MNKQSPSKKSIADEDMNVEPGDQGIGEDNDEDGKAVDPDALAFIKAKKNVVNLHRAKKNERMGKA